MMLLYSLALGFALLLTAPVWAWRMLRQGRYRQGLRERLGIVRPAIAAAAKGRTVVWFHAVSVGETMAAVPLMAALQTALPEALLLLSTTTPTGQAVARERLGADRVFFYPLDFAFAVRPWLRALNPALVVLMESELWPRMLTECSRLGTPVAVVNARVSDRSLPRYLLLRRLWRPLLARTSLLLAQSTQDRDRWLTIGAPPDRTRTVGNLKFDIAPAAESPLVPLLRRFVPAAPLMVAGSTHPGEEQLVLACHEPAHLLILAPRHPQRADEVATRIAESGRHPVRLSEWRLNPEPLHTTDVLLVDTVGELAALYGLASAAVIGGSLVPGIGGHNPLEAARFGIPVLCGTSMENFRAIAGTMQAAGALQSVEAANLCTAVQQALEVAFGPEQANRTRALFHAESGATARTVEALLALAGQP